MCTVQDGQPKNVHLALKSDLGKFLPQFQLKAVMHCVNNQKMHLHSCGKVFNIKMQAAQKETTIEKKC